MIDGAVLVIRIWVERDGDRRRLVGRLKTFVGPESRETTVAVVGSVEELVAATRAWAEQSLGDG